MATLVDTLSRGFDAGERRRLGGFYGAILAMHVVGIGLLLAYGLGHPAFIAVGFLAYSFGLRHAFDADHISAIDNTTRKLLQQGRRPVGVGFFFSLGHSSVVNSTACRTPIAASPFRSEHNRPPLVTAAMRATPRPNAGHGA
jgi:nickel/cobalt transporter (NiCoT) family protein